MAVNSIAKQAPRRRVDVGVKLAILVTIAMVALGYVIVAKTPERAIAIASTEDCSRFFTEAACTALLQRALAIHVSTAPSFDRRDLCELVYDTGNCAELRDGVIALGRYAPKLAAIAMTKERDGIVPLYFNSSGELGANAARFGRRVYFGNRPVGRLRDMNAGGLQLPVLSDLTGAPFSAGEVRRLHGP